MILNINGSELAESDGIWEWDNGFSGGERLCIFTDCNYIVFKADESIPESIIYMPDGKMDFFIPTSEEMYVYPPDAFSKIPHSFLCRQAAESEIYEYRNLALNPADRKDNEAFFPHSNANFVTRDSFAFESRNAIDGFCDNGGHAGFPFQSWGGGSRDDLEYNLYFGRPVIIDKIVLYLRADYAVNEAGLFHDTYWKSAKIVFSDSTEMDISPVKTKKGQEFTFEPKTVTAVSLKSLVRDLDFPTRGFAALSQIEAYGKDIKK